MKMTPRQKECYDLMKCGLTVPEIAVVMNISKEGARGHRQAVNGKIGITERDRLSSRASSRARKSAETVKRVGDALADA